MLTKFELLTKIALQNEEALKTVVAEMIHLKQENKMLIEENDRLRRLVIDTLEWKA